MNAYYWVEKEFFSSTVLLINFFIQLFWHWFRWCLCIRWLSIVFSISGLHMSEKFSSGTINPKQTISGTVLPSRWIGLKILFVDKTIRNFINVNGTSFLITLIFFCYTFLNYLLHISMLKRWHYMFYWSDQIKIEKKK